MKNFKVLLSLVLVIGMIASFAGCTNNGGANQNPGTATNNDVPNNTDTNNNADNNTGNTDNTPTLSGTVTISGSTSVEKIGVALAEEFMALNPGVTVTYQGIGSSGGVTNANTKVTQIGAASRELKDSEKEFGMTEVVIAYDGIALITHPTNPVQELTLEQVQKIYKGEITNWSEVGGNNENIVVVSREDGSGTRGAFEEIVKFENELTSNATIAEGNGNVQSTVAGNPQAIGYVSFTYLNDTVQDLLIEGVQPTVENVQNGSYKVSRPFILMYHEDAMTDASKGYMDFALTSAGQEIVEENGGIAVK